MNLDSHWNQLTKETVKFAICTGELFLPANVERDFKGIAFTTWCDFGCGIGRNGPVLRALGAKILIGYDPMPNMLGDLFENRELYNVLTTKWEHVCKERPFHIWISLVLQHLSTDEICAYFRSMDWPHILYVSTRHYMDDGNRVQKVASDFYHTLWIDCLDVEKAAETDSERHWFGILTPKQTWSWPSYYDVDMKRL